MASSAGEEPQPQNRPIMIEASPSTTRTALCAHPGAPSSKTMSTGTESSSPSNSSTASADNRKGSTVTSGEWNLLAAGGSAGDTGSVPTGATVGGGSDGVVTTLVVGGSAEVGGAVAGADDELGSGANEEPVMESSSAHPAKRIPRASTVAVSRQIINLTAAPTTP